MESLAYAVVVVARVASDVLDEHVDVFALEAVEFAEHQPEVASVAVATDCPEGSEGCEAVGYLDAADVVGVPYLVAGFEVVEVAVVPMAEG